MLLPVAALAQVSVNPGALDRLVPAAPAPVSPSAPVKQPPPRPPAARAQHPAARANPQPPKPRPHPVTVAPAAPPAAVLVPSPEAATASPPPPPVPAVPDAAGDASVLPGGLRITFGAGKADLNPKTEAALRALARMVKADPNADLNVYAYAEGMPDDPSTPRRLSLSRALAARAVLISEGIASTRIYPRALGASSSAGPPDRVDVTQVGVAPAPSP